MRTLRTLSLVAVCLLWVGMPARASELSADLSARRARLMERLGPETLFVVRSAPSRIYSLDVDYEYRQDSNFYYLTGLTQADSVLVLMPGNATKREILFITDRDASREHWTGHLLSREEATARTGVATVLSSRQFDAFMAAMLTHQAFAPVDDKEATTFFAALTADKARVALPFAAAAVDDPPTASQQFIRQLRDRFIGFHPVDATAHLTALRMVKTPYEQKVLVKATDISAEAQIAGMRAAHPGAYEYEVKAAIEAVHRGRGAVSWAYPSIVASGPNATTLHYPESDRQMKDGDLLLVDAACNYEYMSPDITRTYPINGRFTQAQKDIYAVVLKAQDEALKAAVVGGTQANIHDRAVEVIKEGLLSLGLITDTKGDQYRMWFTHGTSHYIGIDVHDVGSRNVPLEAGMAFVIEPGIYVRQSALDALPRTAENLELIATIQPAVKKYADIGVRVEDSFLLEATGAKRLSGAVPRTVDAIESLMRQRTQPATAGNR